MRRRFRGPRDAARAGVGVIHQELALVEEMSVAENLFLGDLPCRGPFIDWPRLMCEAGQLLRRFGVDVAPDAPARSLGIGRKQQVEILKAVRRQSRVLILDEPHRRAWASCTSAARPRASARREGVACVYITHRLEEVREIADRVMVLRDGRSVAAFPTGPVPTGELVRRSPGGPSPNRSLVDGLSPAGFGRAVLGSLVARRRPGADSPRAFGHDLRESARVRWSVLPG